MCCTTSLMFSPWPRRLVILQQNMIARENCSTNACHHFSAQHYAGGQIHPVFKVCSLLLHNWNTNLIHKFSVDCKLVKGNHEPPSGHTLLCQQFLLTLSLYITDHGKILGSQGLNLGCVGVNLTNPIFSHGQLYTDFPEFPITHVQSRVCVLERHPPPM